MAQLVSKQLVGMLIVVIVKISLKECFGEVKTSAAGAGILGVMVCDVLFYFFVLNLYLSQPSYVGEQRRNCRALDLHAPR